MHPEPLRNFHDSSPMGYGRRSGCSVQAAEDEVVYPSQEDVPWTQRNLGNRTVDSVDKAIILDARKVNG